MSQRSAYDVVVIGGSAAGTAAALQLGRIRRSVLLVDSGEPRNAPAAHMHGFPGYDGMPPAEYVGRARSELGRYSVEVVRSRVADVVVEGDVFATTTETGRAVRSRRVLLATGITDILPDLPGVSEHWGERVVHCPWCHGWELRDQRIAVIDTAGLGAHQALLFAELSDRVTLVETRSAGPTDGERRQLQLAGVDIEPGPAQRIVEAGEHLDVLLEDSGALEVDAVAIAPRFEPNLSMVAALDLAVVDHPGGLGSHLDVDGTGQTSRRGVYAAGNVADPMQQVLHAAADGSKVAMAIEADLLGDDLQRAGAAADGRSAWDERYAEHEHMWSDAPNGSLVQEVASLTPGRALDVGCGEGADAIWLRREGWEVAALDISEVAVERARKAGAAAGVDVDFRTEDVLTSPPPQRSFDLVSLSYPALRRDDAIAMLRRLTNAVAPGGRLLVIGHAEVNRDVALEHGFDPDDYLSLDDVVASLDPAEFTVETDDVRERPHQPEGNPHTHDRVLRARRIPA